MARGSPLAGRIPHPALYLLESKYFVGLVQHNPTRLRRAAAKLYEHFVEITEMLIRVLALLLTHQPQPTLCLIKPVLLYTTAGPV